MPGYNSINEVVKKQYEEALFHGKFRDPKTVRAIWNHINLFKNFTGHADFKTFNSDQAKAFKAWLEKQKKGWCSFKPIHGPLGIIQRKRIF